MYSVIYVEDEPLASKQMASYIERHAELKQLCSFRTGEDALAWFIGGGRVDIIFSDVHMPKLSGVEFIRALKQEIEESQMPVVIFATAYSHYALDGFRLEAIDFLLKPIAYSDFEQAATRAISLIEMRRRSSQANVDEGGHITIKADYKTVIIYYQDILYLESVGEYVRFFLRDGRRLMTLSRLKNMEQELPSKLFVRIHRGYIVSISSILSYDKTSVTLNDDISLPLGLSYRPGFEQAMADNTSRK